MPGIGDLVVNLSADTRKFETGISNAQSMTKSFSSGLASILGPAAAAVAGIWGTSAAMSAYKTQDQAERKLAATLAATGGAAGLSAEEIRKYAGELQGLTNFGDEATIAVAGVLATFKEIKGDVFKDALASAQDMAAVMGGDLQGAVVQIGKALNDPIQGISALSRVGVSFTEAQKEQIRVMQESGDIMGAQQIILNELKSEFGGAAKAMADPLTQLSNAVGDFSEVIGKGLYDVLGPVASELTSLAVDAASLAETIRTNLQPVFDVMKAGLSGVVALMRDWGKGILLAVTAVTAYIVAIKAITLAEIAYTKAKVIALAIGGGPKGWAMIAAGAAVAAVAVAGVAYAMKDVTAQAQAATPEVAGMAGGIASMADSGDDAAGKIDKVAEASKAMQDAYKASLTDIQRVNEKAKEFHKTLMEGSSLQRQAADTLTQGFIRQESGFNGMLQDAKDDLAILRGEATKTGLELQKMLDMGVDPAAVEELRQTLAQQEATKFWQDKAAEVKAENEARMSDMKSQADSIKSAIESGQEAYDRKLDDARKLQQEGLLSAEEFQKYEAKLAEENSKDKGDSSSAAPRLAGAMQKGGTEAYSTIVQALTRQQDPVVRATEKQTTILVKAIEKQPPGKKLAFLKEFQNG